MRGQRELADAGYSPGSKRYPTQGSVRMYFGEDGSGSIFFRSWPMNTRRYSGCSVLCPPHTAASSARWVITLAGMPRQIHQQIEFLGRQVDLAVRDRVPCAPQIDAEIAHFDRPAAPASAAGPRRRLARTRASSSFMLNGLVT